MTYQENRTTVAALQIVQAVLDTIVEAGAEGAPATSIYMACQMQGLSHESYETIMSILVRSGRVWQANHVFYARRRS